MNIVLLKKCVFVFNRCSYQFSIVSMKVNANELLLQYTVVRISRCISLYIRSRDFNYDMVLFYYV